MFYATNFRYTKLYTNIQIFTTLIKIHLRKKKLFNYSNT